MMGILERIFTMVFCLTQGKKKVAIRFHPDHLRPKALIYSFNTLVK